MILQIKGIESQLNINNKINVIEIENEKLFRSVIEDIYRYICNIEDKDSNIIFYDGVNNEKIDFNKNIEVIFDILNYEINNKNILSKILLDIKENIQKNEEANEKILNIINNIRKILIDAADEIDIDYTFKEEILIDELIKPFNYKIEKESYIRIIDKLYLCIDILSRFKISEYIIFINLKSIFTCEELEEIYKYIHYKDLKIIIFESSLMKEKLKYENKLIIDSNFDDYIV